MARRFKIFSRCEGAAAVEFALILPVLVMLIAGLIDLSMFFCSQQQAVNISREAARYATMYQLDANGNHITSINLVQYVLNNYGNQYSVNPNTVSYSQVGGAVTVTITTNITWMFSSFLSQYMSLPAQATGTTTMTFE